MQRESAAGCLLLIRYVIQAFSPGAMRDVMCVPVVNVMRQDEPPSARYFHTLDI